MDDKAEVKTTVAYELYRKAVAYQEEKNVIKYVQQAQDFFNGKQYQDANSNNMIRITMNIIAMCVKTKASKICGTPIYLTFTADDFKTDTTALAKFDQYNYNKLNMPTNNYQSAINGLVNGKEIAYMPWDKDDTTYKGIYKGGLNFEHIDLRHFAVANPWIDDIQRQKYVMMWDDYDIEAVFDLLETKSEEEKKMKKRLIARDENYDTDKNQEAVNHKLVKMFTRFFRINGEVYYMCSTQFVDLFLYPHPLSRKVSKKVIEDVVNEYRKKLKQDKVQEDDGVQVEDIPDYNIDYEDLLMNTDIDKRFTDAKYSDEKEKFSLYPFATWAPHQENNDFYTHSDCEDLFSTQMALNFIISMVAKCAENNAYNKIFAKKDALGDQIITNEPSQVIFDYSNFTNGWGIKMAESQPLPNGLLDFANQLLSMTRVVYGFNEVLDGSITNQDISGYAIQQMIKQANTSIEQQQRLFWKFQEDLAAIRLMYYKHYVDSARYTTELTDAEYQGQEQAREILRNGVSNGLEMQSVPDVDRKELMKQLNTQTHKVKVKEFKNEDIWGVNFDIAIDAVQGLADSELVEQQTFDNLILNNGIQNISPTLLNLYLQAAPNISPRTKAALDNVVKNLEQSENQQLKNQIQQLTQTMQQLMGYTKNLEAQNGYQSEFVKNLQAEFGTKINTQNKIINGLVKELDRQTEQEVSEGEVKSNNAKGVGGTHKTAA